MSAKRDIKIEFDDETQDYYIIWEPPVIIGLDKSEKGALSDLREAAHFSVDTLIDSKLADIDITESKQKED